MRHISILINAATLNQNSSSIVRQAGFSDGWFDSSTSTQVLNADDKDLINLRAALLPSSSSVVGARISLLDEFGKSTGRSRVYQMSITGGAAGATGDPRESLKYTVYGNDTTNELQLYIQNVPQARIVNGSYATNAVWEAAVKDYVDFCFNKTYRFFGFDQSMPVAPIVKIYVTDPNPNNIGTVTLERGNVWAPGAYVRALRCQKVLRGKYREIPNGHHVNTSVGFTLTIDNWTAGATTGGHMQTWAKVLLKPLLDDEQKKRPLVCMKKVGKPFFLFRGRASKTA